MYAMFGGARSFNGDISKWEVRDVQTMHGMFGGAASFNGDISKWDVSRVINMYGMFWGATSFNSDISEWDVSSVSNMYGMFMDAAAFNIDISKWDVSSVVTMDYMFWHWQTTSFKQKLCGDAWVRSKASKKAMFTGSFGSISSQVCTLTTADQYVSRRPIPERELIVRALITTPVNTTTQAITSSNKRACSKCGTFEKSGRASCCAPGGGWYKDCGGAGNRNADHRWFEGVEACKRKSKANSMQIDPLTEQAVAAFMFSSLCFDLYPHIHTSSYDDDTQFHVFQMRHHREIWKNKLLRSQWFLVRELRECW